MQQCYAGNSEQNTLCAMLEVSNYFNASEQWDVIHWMLKKHLIILLSPHRLGFVVLSNVIVTCRSDSGI